MSVAVVVLDASVGVKWLREETGSQEARELLMSHGRGEIQLVVPVIFMHEVLDVARRVHGVETACALLAVLERDDLFVLGADAPFFAAALEMCTRLGCTVYDAAAPVAAEMLGAELVSADRWAHGDFAGVRIIGADDRT